MTDIVQDYTKKCCAPHVWLPSVHTQHKESMLYQTKGCPYAPIYLNAPISLNGPLYVGMPHMFGCPYVWMPPICLDTPMFRCPHMFG